MFNEVLFMGYTMNHTVINPTQLCSFGTELNYNPMSYHILPVITAYNDAVTIVCVDNH